MHSAESAAWRRWNAGEQRAIRLAAENATALLEVEHRTCPAARDVRGRLPLVDAYR
jgi:hypothetical protein